MEKEELIKVITKEVLNRLNEKISGQFPGEREKNDNKILVLTPRYSECIYDFLSHIKVNNTGNDLLLGTYEKDINYNLPGDFELLDISDEDVKQKIIIQMEKYNKIYCLSPGMKLLERIKDGDDRRFLEWFIIRALINDIEVQVLTDISFSSPRNTFQQLLRDLLNEVSEMGIKVENIDNTAKGTKDNKKADNNSTGKNLITRKEIDKLQEEGRTTIRIENEVITPLAIDRAREIGMEVVF